MIEPGVLATLFVAILDRRERRHDASIMPRRKWGSEKKYERGRTINVCDTRRGIYKLATIHSSYSLVPYSKPRK